MITAVCVLCTCGEFCDSDLFLAQVTLWLVHDLKMMATPVLWRDPHLRAGMYPMAQSRVSSDARAFNMAGIAGMCLAALGYQLRRTVDQSIDSSVNDSEISQNL